jgi:bifunctional UDP-N-acetylglucosamine pyrophosphorylase/glucosamine-1-phosphate N-acetyltransferase
MGALQPELAALILAAGQGTRMKSGRAKVLHELAGQPMLHHPLAAVAELGAERVVVVVGRDADEVQATFAGRARFVVQEPQRGTGHAVLEARSALADFTGDVLILYGDTPLLRPETLRDMRELKARSGASLVLLSARTPLPGRVVRDAQGRVARIVEVTDASPEELAIEESNTGVYLVDAEILWKALAQVDDRNAQGEIYLTDIVEGVLSDGHRVEALPLGDPLEGLGVNTRAELAQAARGLRRRVAERLMDAGVTLIDPDQTWIDVDVQVGKDSVIEPGCVIQGATRIGERVRVRPHCTIEASEIEDDCQHPSRPGRPHRKLRRGEEQRPRGGREGRPPRVHRRRRRGRRRQLRLWLDHGQLRLGGQAPHARGCGRQRRLQREPGGSGDDRGGSRDRRGLDRHEGRP